MIQELKSHRSGDFWRGISVPEVVINGIPLDLTGATATFQVKDMQTWGTVLDASSDADIPGITIGSPTGPIVVLGRVVTLPPATYQVGLKVWPSTGKPLTIIVAQWTITRAPVTRADPV